MPNRILLAILMTLLLLLVLTMAVMAVIVGHLIAWTNRVKPLVVQGNPLA